jgi:cell division septation protein DedD
MSKDYKPRTAPAPAGKKMNPMFLGIIIGLLMGIAIALGVALWLNRSALPGLEKSSKTVDMPPKLEAKGTAPSTGTPGKPDAPKVAEVGKDGDKPRFEFYQILPGDKDAGKTGRKTEEPKPAKPEKAAEKPAEKVAEKPADKAAEKVAAPAKPADKPGSPREIYYLQAGAFQNLAEADNLKARIALLGLSASVTATNVPDKGTLHRVRLGPYQSLEPVNRIKTALSESGIPAAVVKTTDALN